MQQKIEFQENIENPLLQEMEAALTLNINLLFIKRDLQVLA